MKLTTIATLAGAAAVFCVAPVMTGSASAGTLSTGWSYSMDAVGDGSGGNVFDIRGMAMKLDGDNLFVAITGNTPLTGTAYSGAADGNIGWGDLFFNFTGKSFSNAQGSLFGVRFAGTNDSGAAATGVYSGVTAKSVTGDNSGYASLNSYYSHSQFDVQNTQGNNGLATKQAVLDYYGGSGPINNVIGSGTKVGEITALTLNQLSTLNFGNDKGSEVFGFSFNKNLLPNASFVSNLFLECGNDGVAFSASAAPEPTTMAGAALGMAAIGGLKRMRRRKQEAAS